MTTLPLLSLVALPFIGSLLAAFLPANARNAESTLAGLIALFCAVQAALYFPEVAAGGVIRQEFNWLPSMGLNFVLRMDGYAWMFSMLVLGIGALVMLYARYYMSPADPVPRFFSFLLAFMGAMSGVVLSGNLIQIVLFWELTSLFSFLLIGYWHHRRDARRGARMALTVTGAGGLCLLAGMLVLGHIVGSYDLDVVLASGVQVRTHPLYMVVLVLVLLGALTKSAQFPFHFWLPHAMAAPTPVSAYLHSATMVKAGVFLLARLWPVLAGTDEWFWLVTSSGLITLLIGGFAAIFQHDLKSLLAYSTLSHLGLITTLLGLNSPLAAVAAVFHILNHATFKASLFMAVGIIDHETGSRDMRRLGGLMSVLPWTGTLAIIAAAAMAGLPLTNGFLSKEMFFGEAVTAQSGWAGAWADGMLVAVVATLAGACSVAYSLRFVHDVFFNGPRQDLPNPHPHDPPWLMRLPVLLLVLASLAVGMFPAYTLGPLVEVAARAVLGGPTPPYHLALWHGFNLPLLMSGLAVLGGVVFYVGLQRHWKLHLHHPRGWTGRLFFTRALDGLIQGAQAVIRLTDIGSLQRHVAWMLVSVIVVAAWPFLESAVPLTAGQRALLPAPASAIAVWLVLLVGSAALVLGHRDRFKAVLLTGVVGMVTALTFLALSAPDLALTQLSVEVVATVIMLMGLALLPARTPRESSGGRRLRDAGLASVAGLGVAFLCWMVLTRDHDAISWYFLAQSLPGGGGTNVVNVTLVDFRGYDTFGEITVLGIAGVGVLAMLDGFKVRRPAQDEAGRPWTFARQPLMLRVAARLILPMALVMSAYIYWRGHNLPGGGFIAGLITAVALVLQYMAQGQERTEALLHGAQGRRFTRWIGTGLSIAGLTGVGALLWGRNFLTSAHGHPHVPGFGEVPLASAALFDLGVYITVVGATLLTLSVLGHASKEGRGATSAPVRSRA